MISPYFNRTFFSFFWILVQRFKDFFIGRIGFQELATDEIQILVLVCIGVASALVGAFLILRKMTMLANSISHTILLGVVLVFIGVSPNRVLKDLFS